jgi:hypothetical protein
VILRLYIQPHNEGCILPNHRLMKSLALFGHLLNGICFAVRSISV